MKHLFLGATILTASLQPVYSQTYVRIEDGELPIILSAPHGGYLRPSNIKDRTCAGCTTITDAYTLELTDELSRALFELTGKRPYVVINLLDRIKLDANRGIIEGADGDLTAEAAWHVYHDAMSEARSQVSARFGKGLVLDIHGHGHIIQRLELGYLPDEEELRVSDQELNTSRGQRNTFNSLVNSNVNGLSFAQLIRGPKSLGQLYHDRGYPAVPSQTTPFPLTGEPYFAGGYITQQYGSRNGGTVDAVQLEANRHGVRHTEEQRKAFADSTALVLLEFFSYHYGIDLFTIETSTELKVPHPTRPGLSQNHPNPFNPTTQIRYQLSETGPVRLSVYDLLGREVAVLIEAIQSSGDHHIRFNANGLASGIYLYRLETAAGSVSKKMHLVK